ncbi:tyrosine-type recombinase/integrase [Stappia indica]|uniref:tyrosine-type recombinase/integrase n=1 Tax=Stappia indica TaxID=538381 RepID=UPI001CD5E715|nr:site-specific integrase [Stappia indica]MCA1300682.1 site-specific integrase [Stappia indica]
MSKDRLTKTAVERAEPRERDYMVWCGKMQGFGCRVWPSGKKTFVAQYRVAGRERKKTIGTYGVLTVEQARKEAEKYLALARTGQDLAGEERRARAEMSVGELCSEYLRHGVALKKGSTVKTDIGRINGHILPLLGRKKISAVTRADIERFMHDVAKGKTAKDRKIEKGRSIIRGGEGTATRTVRLLGGVFSYAITQGYLTANPCAGVKKFPDKSNERYLTQDEIDRLGATLTVAEMVGLPWHLNDGARSKHRPKAEQNLREKVSPHVTGAIRLLLLTGCRLREILHLKWREVDFQRKDLDLPDSKTGRKVVYLSDAALEVLRALPKVGTYVVLGKQPDKPRSDLKRPWERISRHAGIEDVRLHDLRHTFASVQVQRGASLPMIGALLGHKSTSTTARYAHLADDPLRRALNAGSESLTGAMLPKAKDDRE